MRHLAKGLLETFGGDGDDTNSWRGPGRSLRTRFFLGTEFVDLEILLFYCRMCKLWKEFSNNIALWLHLEDSCVNEQHYSAFFPWFLYRIKIVSGPGFRHLVW